MTSQAKLDEFAKKGLEAQKKYKKATTTNLLKWKIDWEQGARHARDMVKNFRCAGPEFRRDYIEALKCSAKAHEESNSIHTAGTEYETLAQALKEEKDWRGAAEANVQASRMFRGKSEWDKAALVLTRAAEIVEEKEPSQALSYMDQACSIYEEQERYEFHEATFKKAITMAVKLRRYDSAIELIHRQNKIILHRMETFERDLYKNLLSIVVIRFAEREYEKAQAEFNKAQNMENFGRSEEWSAASDLFTAYSAGSNEELAEVLKRHSCFKYLTVPVAQLARKLQFNAEVVAQGKQRAKDFLEGPDDPDSDEYETDDGENSEPEEKKVPARKKPVPQDDDEEEEEEEEVKSVPPPKKAAVKKPVTRKDDDADDQDDAPPPTKRVTSSTSTSTAGGAKKSTRAALFDRDEPEPAKKSASSTRAALFAKNEPASASTRSALFAKSSDEAGSSARAALFAKDDSPKKKKKVTSPKSSDDKEEEEPAPAPPNKKGGVKAASNPFGDEEDDTDTAPISSPKKTKKKKSVTDELDELAKWAAEAAKEGEGEGEGEGEETTTTTEKPKKKKKSVTDEADELDLTGATITDENENEEGLPKPKKLKKKKKKPVHDSTLDEVEVGDDGLVNLT